jgi:aldose 1-epimerase
MQGTRTVVPAAGHGELDGFDRVTLAAGELEAAFAPGAEMAATSLRHAGEDLLHRHGGLAAYAQRSGVMSIPIRHPGANRLAGFDYAVEGTAVRLPGGPPLGRCEEHGLPIHGLLGGSRHWRVRSVAGDGAGWARVSARSTRAASR